MLQDVPPFLLVGSAIGCCSTCSLQRDQASPLSESVEYWPAPFLSIGQGIHSCNVRREHGRIFTFAACPSAAFLSLSLFHGYLLLAALQGVQLDNDNEQLKSLLQKCVKKGRATIHGPKS